MHSVDDVKSIFHRFNPKTPGLSILHISPGRVSCFLPQIHPDPICIFYLISPGVVSCVSYSGSAGWGGGRTGFARALSHTALSRKMLRHFACNLGALKNRILQIWKKIQIPEDLKILELFSDLQYSVSKCSKIACKVSRHFPAERCEDLCVTAWMKHVDSLCKPFWST
jgi:hypothetical protein